eukprot:11221391-Lingulodinium_polyedra.AAC.1
MRLHVFKRDIAAVMDGRPEAGVLATYPIHSLRSPTRFGQGSPPSLRSDARPGTILIGRWTPIWD